MSIHLFTELLKELGQVIELPGLKPDESGYCCLAFDEKLQVHMQSRDEQNDLTLFCDVGTCTEDNKAQLLELAMDANFFWQDTNGFVLSFNKEKQTIVLTERISLDGIRFPSFEKILEKFVNTSEYWVDKLSTLLDEETEETQEDSPANHTPTPRDFA